MDVAGERAGERRELFPDVAHGQFEFVPSLFIAKVDYLHDLMEENGGSEVFAQFFGQKLCYLVHEAVKVGDGGVELCC